MESACSAAASCALITFKFSLSRSVILFFISLTSKLFSTTTLIKSTFPTESRSCCAVLNSNKAKVAPPAAKAESAIPTIVNVAGVAPANTVTLSPMLNSKFSAVTVSITTSFLFTGALPSRRVHCFANSLLSQAVPNVGANPFDNKTVSPSTTFMNCAKPTTSPHAALTPGSSWIS